MVFSVEMFNTSQLSLPTKALIYNEFDTFINYIFIEKLFEFDPIISVESFSSFCSNLQQYYNTFFFLTFVINLKLISCN